MFLNEIIEKWNKMRSKYLDEYLEYIYIYVSIDNEPRNSIVQLSLFFSKSSIIT